MNGYLLIRMAREHAETLRTEARSLGYSQEEIDKAKHRPMDLGGPLHVAWLKMRMASEIDGVANAMEAECRAARTPLPE